MSDLAVLAGVLVAVLCGGLAVVHSATARRFTFLGWALAAIGGVYGLGWALVVRATVAGDNPRWQDYLFSHEAYFLLHSACVLVLVSGLGAGWALAAPRLRPVPRPRTDVCVPGLPRAEFAAAWLILVTAIVTQWLYTWGYGGFLYALTSAAAFRSGLLPTANPWGFLYPFGPLALLAAFMFYGLLLAHPRRIALWIPLLLSIAASAYVFLLRLGRIDALAFVATFVFGYVFYRTRRPLVVIGVAVAGGMAILAGAFWLTRASGINLGEGLGGFLAREMAFPFVTFFEHVASTDGPRWFYDIVVIPVFFLPESLWTGVVENVSDVTTALIKGAPKGVSGVSGGMPIDLVTLGLLQASAFGILVIGILFGMLLRAVDRLALRISHPGVRCVVGVHLGFKLAVLGVFYAQPSLMVKGNMYLIAGALIYAWCRALTTRSVAVAAPVP